MALPKVMDATARPPHVWVVKPDGHFYPAPVAVNINDGVVMLADGEAALRPWAIREGYLFLADACDSPEQAEMLGRYLDASRGVPNMEPIPDQHMPKICKERRAANKTAKTFAEFADFKVTAGESSEDKPAAKAPGKARSRK